MSDSKRSTITSSWTRRVVLLAHEAGLDLRRQLEELGITREVLDDRHGRIRFASHARLVAHVAERLDRPGLGIDLGAEAAAADFGVVGLLAESCATLGEALEAVRRFNALANEASLMDFWIEGDRLFIRDGHLRDGRPTPRLLAEATMAFYLTMIRQSTGLAEPLEELWLAHDGHAGWTPARREAFAAPVRFGRSVNALVLPAELVDAPFVSARPELSVHLTRLAEHLQEELPPLDETSARVAAHVRSVLAEGGPPPLARVARALGTTARTLQRQLEASSRAYSDILDEVRREVAHTLLTESSLKLEVVAERAGYSDGRSFRRACVRWFGETPGSYRKARR